MSRLMSPIVKVAHTVITMRRAQGLEVKAQLAVLDLLVLLLFRLQQRQ